MLIPNDLTPWEYLNKRINVERFESYLNSQEIDNAYRYLKDVYGIMLDVDPIHNLEAIEIYEKHIRILRKALNTTSALKLMYVELFKSTANQRYISKEYQDNTRERLVKNSISYLLHSKAIRLERVYQGRELDEKGYIIPNLKNGEQEYKTPYQLFLPYLLLWSKIVLASCQQSQMGKCIPSEAFYAAQYFVNEYPEIKTDVHTDKWHKVNYDKNTTLKKQSKRKQKQHQFIHSDIGVGIVYAIGLILMCLPMTLLNEKDYNMTKATTEIANTISKQQEDSILKSNSTKKLLIDDRQPNMNELSQSASNENIRRDYVWLSFSGHSKQCLQIPVNAGIYLYYKKLPRQYSNDCKNYISDDFTISFLQQINKSIDQLCIDGDMDSEWAKVKETIAFVQSIPYKTDVESTGKEEWPKYPYETIFDQCGDCEDHAFLLAGLLKLRGYDIALILLPEHMAIGISAHGINGDCYEYNGVKYYFIETTSSGWDIGQIPDKYQHTLPEAIIPVK